MEILRESPYDTLLIEVDVPSGYTDENFTITIVDMATLSVSESEVEKSSNENITITLPAKYDADYEVVITDSDDEIIHTELYELRRPYTDIVALSDGTATSIDKYTKHEEVARAIIDSIIPQGFYYKKKTVEESGLGSDYIPLWTDAKKILEVYENNVLVTDREFEITKDKTAIVQKYEELVNRAESQPLIFPAVASDSMDMLYQYKGFKNGYDYRIVLETGYVRVPSDIKRATQLLIEDLDCGKLDYYKRYIESYSTEQFKLAFNEKVFDGTGNIIVDKILSKYQKSIIRPGVL